MANERKYPNLFLALDSYNGPYPVDDWVRGQAFAELGAAERCASDLEAARKRIERLADLVRYKRAELHHDELISDEEYAEICQDHTAVARLEGYDAIKIELEAARKRIAELEEAIIRIDETVDEGWKKWSEANCQEPECGCVTEWIKSAIRDTDRP